MGLGRTEPWSDQSRGLSHLGLNLSVPGPWRPTSSEPGGTVEPCTPWGKEVPVAGESVYGEFRDLLSTVLRFPPLVKPLAISVRLFLTYWRGRFVESELRLRARVWLRL